MSLSERRRQFEAASKEDPLVTRRTKFHKLFGVSNSAKIIGRGLQLGVVNLDNVDAGVDSFAFACTMVFLRLMRSISLRMCTQMHRQ